MRAAFLRMQPLLDLSPGTTGDSVRAGDSPPIPVYSLAKSLTGKSVLRSFRKFCLPAEAIFGEPAWIVVERRTASGIRPLSASKNRRLSASVRASMTG